MALIKPIGPKEKEEINFINAVFVKHDLRKRLEGRSVSSWEMKVSVTLPEACTQESSENVNKTRRREKGANTKLGRQQRKMNT